MLGIFGESFYRSSIDDFKKLSVLAQIFSFVMKEMHVLSKETAKRLRATSHSCQGKQILKCHHAKN